ncbi:hypothetical protein [Hymenobacter cellulosivorans]|uniref:Uncharacterized protein n=1 Tax=Hymenobacter cellulosivorans TaxID=2932249 RepID=A0ABY4FAK4_9BACT|nr:hypothetical protein [Hymenobacter cellulosivorans]UOQ53043.1 hypothetical protein MUN80_25315 [Hymenobacter cellulosivorans]
MAVNYTAELLGRVQTWLNHSATKRRTREQTQELHQLYEQITGQSAAGCTSCNFQGYVDLLQAHERQSIRFLFPETVEKSIYTIAPGYENEQFVHESYNKAVTAENLTDKDAEFFISQGFPHAFLKNGKPLEAEAAAEAAPKPKKADYQARYKELHGVDADEKLTIAQLQEAIDAKEKEQAESRD